MSVLLTVYNEERGIQRVLNYLSRESDFLDDVVVVSDACRDGTDDILLRWLNRREPFHKEVVTRKERYGRGNAIKLGLSLCRNDVCVIMAGDMQPFPDSLPNLLIYFNDSRIGAVTGHPILVNGSRTIGDCLNQVMWRSHNRVGEISSREGRFFHLNGEMYGVRKSALRDGYFFNVLNEDNMIGYIIKKNGYLVKWAKDVVYYMKYPSSFWQWLKVRKRSIYGRAELIQKTRIREYGWYELRSRDYVANIFRIGFSNPKFLAALIFGVPAEFLVRVYYTFRTGVNLPYSSDLWQPTSQSKW